MINRTNQRTTWLRKSWDLKHGYGWFCHIYDANHNVGFGFSKNKFTAIRLAVKDIKLNASLSKVYE